MPRQSFPPARYPVAVASSSICSGTKKHQIKDNPKNRERELSLRGPDLSRAEAISLCRNQIAMRPSGASNDRYIDSSRFLVPFLGFAPLLTNSRRTCYKRRTAREFQMKKRYPNLAILLLALGFLAGCAGTRYPAHPQYKERSSNIRTVALIPPYVK